MPALVEEIAAAEEVGLDLETTGLDPRRDNSRVMSLATGRGAWVVDVLDIDPAPVLEALRGKTLLIHNAAFDLVFLRELGYEHKGEVVDTMLLTSCFTPGPRSRQPTGSKLPLDTALKTCVDGSWA